MRWRYKIYYLCLGIAVFAAFIGAFKLLEVHDVSNEAMKMAIEQIVDVSTMHEDQGTRFRKNYGLRKNAFEQFLYYCPKSNMEAQEILILKTSSKSQRQEVKQIIEERMKSQSDSFKDYNKTQYEILKDYILEVQDDYVILIVSNEGKRIRASLHKLF